MALHIKVRRTRPRVFLSEETIPELRKRTETTHLEEWSQLAVWARGIAKAPPAHRLREDRLAERGRRAALLYALRRDEGDAALALEIAPRLAELATSPAAVEGLAQVYDSLWPLLPGEARSDLAGRLLDGARALYAERVSGAAILAESRTEAVAPVLAAGLALYGDRPEANALIGDAVHAARDLMGTLQYFLEEDGGFPLGWERSLVHAGAFPKLALLAESGLGQRLPDDIPWLAKYAEFLDAGARPGGAEGPSWPEGGATGRRQVDLWRILAFAAARTGAGAAARLLSRLDLAGHQDDRILYEKRPLPLPDAAPAGRARATLYRRAGVAVFREDAGGKGVELVVRCPPAALDGDDRGAGTVSLALDGELVLGAAGRPGALSVTGATPPERRFPRTRRELNLPGNRLSEVLAFEAGVGGEFDWMQADLAPAYGPAAEAALRTVVFLPASLGSPRPAVVLADEVRLADESCDWTWVHHFASPPAQVRPSEERPDRRETGAGAIEVAAGTARLRVLVVLPPKAAFTTEDAEVTEDGEIRGRPFSVTSVPSVVRSAAAQPLWRVRIAPAERERTARFCQVLLVSVEGEPASGGACAALLEGAWGAEAAGRLVIFGEESTRRVEGVTSGEVRGVVAVGLAPGARVTLEAAGAPRVERAASDFGAVWLDAEIPRETGFVIEVEPAAGAPSGRA